MTNQEAAGELQYAIDLIKQDGKDWLDERDIPILEAAISALKAQDLQPNLQPNLQLTCNQLATDCISREAAIDAICTEGTRLERNGTVAMAEIKQWCVDILEALPSAQPDIIHCGECKHRDPEDHKCDCGHDILWQLPRDDGWYCADAERKG